MGRGKRAVGTVRPARPAAQPGLAAFAARLATLSPEVAPGRVMSERERVRYANVVLDAAGVEPGDAFVIEARLEAVEIAVDLAAEAYRRGARRVLVVSDREELAEMESALAGSDAELREARDQSAWDEAVFADAAFVSLNDGVAWDEAARVSYRAATEGDEARWVVCYWPTKEQAALVYPDESADKAQRRLASDLLWLARQGPTDPPGAYERHLALLRRRSRALNELSLDAVVLVDDELGTRLEVGLLSTSEFRPPEWETRRGRRFAPNVPTEEVFTTPDPRRVEGTFETTRPAWLDVPVYRVRGSFKGGELEREGFVVEPSHLTDAVYDYLAANRGLLSLGELALVGDDSRVREAGRLYYLNNVDENAGCHVALGDSYRAGLSGLVDDPRRNRQPAGLHHDLTVSGPRTSVYGKTKEGRLVPLIVEGRWQI